MGAHDTALPAAARVPRATNAPTRTLRTAVDQVSKRPRMDPAALPADAAAKIAGWLADEAVDGSYLAFVARHVDADDATWRWCCGSTCDPCVVRLGRVVDRARQTLAIGGDPAATDRSH